jgi:lysosomal Pro-X carboxypeptidase
VLTNLSRSLVAVDIAEGAHHLDLMFSNAADPPSVVRAREVELAAIRGWIHEAAGAST